MTPGPASLGALSPSLPADERMIAPGSPRGHDTTCVFLGALGRSGPQRPPVFILDDHDKLLGMSFQVMMNTKRISSHPSRVGLAVEHTAGPCAPQSVDPRQRQR